MRTRRLVAAMTLMLILILSSYIVWEQIIRWFEHFTGIELNRINMHIGGKMMLLFAFTVLYWSGTVLTALEIGKRLKQ